MSCSPTCASSAQDSLYCLFTNRHHHDFPYFFPVFKSLSTCQTAIAESFYTGQKWSHCNKYPTSQLRLTTWTSDSTIARLPTFNADAWTTTIISSCLEAFLTWHEQEWLLQHSSNPQASSNDLHLPTKESVANLLFPAAKGCNHGQSYALDLTALEEQDVSFIRMAVHE